MRWLITGAAGHLGEALMRGAAAPGRELVGLDRRSGPFVQARGDLADREFVTGAMRGVRVVLHAATLHKPHVATHSKRDFVDANIIGTLNLLEEAARNDVRAFIFTSTTSVYGDAMRPTPGGSAVWITEDVTPIPKNIYGATKAAAEDLCALFARNHGLNCIILRTSRFFPEADDDASTRAAYEDANIKLNEYLYRRVDVEDVVSAHLAAVERAAEVRFGKFIVSAATPFVREDAAALGRDASAVLRKRVPEFEPIFAARGWRMLPSLDRVYDSSIARSVLDWRPRWGFQTVLARVAHGGSIHSELARAIGAKGYHDEEFADGPYPV